MERLEFHVLAISMRPDKIIPGRRHRAINDENKKQQSKFIDRVLELANQKRAKLVA